MGGRLNLYFPLCADAGPGPELLAGSRAMRGYLSTRMNFEDAGVEEAFDPREEGGIVGRSAIAERLTRARSFLELSRPDGILAVGGGCGIELPIVSCLRRRHPGLCALWLDAHGDLNSPASSPSGHFHGMALRFLLEPDLDPDISPSEGFLEPSDVVLVGCRDLDLPEEEYIRAKGIGTRGEADNWTIPDRAPLYAHVDLDVLDLSEYPNVKCPVEGGLSIPAVSRFLRRHERRREHGDRRADDLPPRSDLRRVGEDMTDRFEPRHSTARKSMAKSSGLLAGALM
jgi:arginase